MRKAKVFNHGKFAGYLIAMDNGHYAFDYLPDYVGPPVSLTLPVAKQHFEFMNFPAFFDGLLPEGILLEALLKKAKIDRDDLFSQLVTVGQDLVGSVTVQEDE